jgi:hypothetical protein
LSLGSYRWLNALLIPFMIVGFLALGVLWAAVFHYLAEEHARTFPPAVFLFKPFHYGLVFAVPGLFLGILSSILPVLLLGRLLLGRRYIDYLYWEEARVGLAGNSIEPLLRGLSGLALLTGVIAAVFTLLVMNWYARFTEDEIAIKRLIGFGEEVHPYSQVEQMVLTSHKNQKEGEVAQENLHIRFADGRTWSTDQTFFLPPPGSERDRLLEFLTRKTGKPVTRARRIEDVPGW